MTHGGNYLYKRPRGKACIVNILMQSVNEMLNEWSNISLFVDSTFFIFKAGLCEIHEVGHLADVSEMSCKGDFSLWSWKDKAVVPDCHTDW